MKVKSLVIFFPVLLAGASSCVSKHSNVLSLSPSHANNSIKNDSIINKELLEKVFVCLDDVIGNSKIYKAEKQNRIGQIKKKQAETEQFSIERYTLNSELVKLNYAYSCDSTLRYLNQNINIARNLNDQILLNESIIKTASFMAHSAGLYKQASDMIKEVDKKYLTQTDYIDYYQAYLNIYAELYTSIQNIEDVNGYAKTMELYRDTLIYILPHNNELYLLLVEERLRNQNKFHEALEINDVRLKIDTFASPEYALATFHRAYTYRMMGDNEKYKYYLALSALSDIVSAIRDHASLWMLAEKLLAEKDIDRAYNYMRFSWDEILLFNAHARKWQSADILYSTDGLYNKMLERQNRELFYFVILISLLTVLLVIALYYNYSHRKKLSVMGRNLQNANEALTESNRIKEEYIGQFIRMCSLYIERLDEYRRLVIKRIKGKQIDELLKISEEERESRRETDDLLHDFDVAFLNIFPNFVEKFNKLLLPDKQITLKKDEILNTELRVYALIRLGITDSAKIAEFLHLSASTVYNTRVKVKNKAIITREEFDDRVKNIG
ncbi:MAG: DUF6377 domain-containing protein [Bacteroidales bacterium]|jgi:hypothetical protein|nr:DUF6377 domain-containing protein [Bacteroidales bacterium]